MPPAPTRVAFVCLHGSAKSVLASEYLNRVAGERGLDLRATASGREPDDAIPGNVVRRRSSFHSAATWMGSCPRRGPSSCGARAPP